MCAERQMPHLVGIRDVVSEGETFLHVVSLVVGAGTGGYVERRRAVARAVAQVLRVPVVEPLNDIVGRLRMVVGWSGQMCLVVMAMRSKWSGVAVVNGHVGHVVVHSIVVHGTFFGVRVPLAFRVQVIP